MYRLFLAIRYLLTRPINLLGMFGIAQKSGEEPVDNRLQFLGHHLGSFCA